MPGGLPIVKGRRPGVELVPGVGASFLGVGVLDFRLGVDDLSFYKQKIFNLGCNLFCILLLRVLRLIYPHTHVNRKMKTCKSMLE